MFFLSSHSEYILGVAENDLTLCFRSLNWTCLAQSLLAIAVIFVRPEDCTGAEKDDDGLQKRYTYTAIMSVMITLVAPLVGITL